jgi:glycosyltransferase involved in cell wall biosynthesis
MRLIFVNHAHPQIAHVSGMRLAYFAKAMAGRGHQVILLTASLPQDTESAQQGFADLAQRLAVHDWSEPLLIAVQPVALPSLQWARSGQLPAVLRRCLTFWHLAYHGGVLEDWVAACRPHLAALAQAFRPELVWGTFGNTSTLVLAQSIARQSACPWLMDIKDNWSAFLKPGLREWLAWRFRDASGYTGNAEHQLAIAAKWLYRRKTAVVYSGVAEAFFAANTATETAANTIVLIGSTYDQTVLRVFLRGVKTWLQSLTVADAGAIRFIYVGADGQRVAAALAEAQLPCPAEVLGYVPVDELAGYCRGALANAYLWAPFTFHHKLLELLACGRPVIAFPGEAPESMALAAQTDTLFVACSDERALHEALNQAWRERAVGPRTPPVQHWRWQALAGQLEAFFQTILPGQRR